MPALDDLPLNRVPALRALTARLKHDLGKYIAFGARWLADDATQDERRDALVADLLHTRRGPSGEHDAHEVWAPYGEVLLGEAPLDDGPWAGLADDPDVKRIAHAMAELRPLADALRTGRPVDATGLDRGLTLTRQVSTACRDLHRRVNEAATHHG